MLNGSLNGKVAIVTGGAQGIGAEFVRGLRGAGARVVVADVVPPAAEAGVSDDAFIKTDVSDENSVQRMLEYAIDRFGAVDLLVNNAGIFSSLAMKPTDQISAEEWDRVMAVNVRGVFQCAKAVVPHMRARGSGKIINVASATVFKGAPLLLHYVASKGAVIAMTRSMAREFGAFGVCVNALAPGLIMTENVSANEDWNGAASTATVSTRALKRDGTPADLVGSLLYLCSPLSDFVTGQCLVVDGGSVMR